MVLLTNPNEEVLARVLKDTTAIRPVTAHARGKEKGRVWLLEEVTARPEFLLLLKRHTLRLRSVGLGTVEWEVVTLEVTLHVQETLDTESLEITTLLEGDEWWKLEALDGAASAHTSGEHILALWINISIRELGEVHVGRLLGIRSIATVTSTDDWIKELLEDLIGLLITGGHTDGLDVRMARVVDTSLDALGKSHTSRSLLVLELVIDLLGEDLSHEVGVLGEVWHLSWALAVHGEGGALLRAVVWGITTSELDPSLELHNRW